MRLLITFGKLAEEESVKYRVHCALGDKFSSFGMLTGMDVRFSKTTTNKLAQASDRLLA